MTPSNTFRRWVLFSSTVIGALALAATALFVIFIVGRFGSPTPLLLLFLLCGPVALLPCVLFDMWKPSLGGITLCSLSLVEAGFIALSNQRPQGFAIHDAALGSLCLAFPMFVIGTLLFRSSKLDISWLNWVWLIEVFVAASATGYFLWHVGAPWPPDRDVDDAEPPVQHVQRLGAGQPEAATWAFVCSAVPTSKPIHLTRLTHNQPASGLRRQPELCQPGSRDRFINRTVLNTCCTTL